MLACLDVFLLTLAWRPVLDPIALGTGLAPTLLTLIPLVLVISVVYKALKLDDLRKLPWQCLSLSGWIIGLLSLAAAGTVAADRTGEPRRGAWEIREGLGPGASGLADSPSSSQALDPRS